MLCCVICIDENTQVCTAIIVFRWHRWFHLIKNWAWFINHVAGDGASASLSVLRMILICCNHVLNLAGDFKGASKRPPCTLSNRVFRGGHLVFQGGQAHSGPLVIRPLNLTTKCKPPRWRHSRYRIMFCVLVHHCLDESASGYLQSAICTVTKAVWSRHCLSSTWSAMHHLTTGHQAFSSHECKTFRAEVWRIFLKFIVSEQQWNMSEWVSSFLTAYQHN